MLTHSSSEARSLQRTEAMLALAAELGQRSANVGSGRRRTALIALRTLAEFAREQFAFLRAGLAPGALFEADDRYPLDFLLEATARRVSFDMDVLLRTIAHRNETSSTPAMRATLALADRLALDAIELAVRHGLVERTVLLTYFQKSPTIRLIPYVPLAMIGFDFAAVGDKSRLLAIAHETGHYVYRQLMVNYASNLDAQIEAAATPATEGEGWPAWLLAWQEEIFADIYSALVAGPLAVLGLQELVQPSRLASLTSDDGDHPLGALRPEILITTIQMMAAHGPAERHSELARAADLLATRWQAQLAERGVPRTFVPAGASETVPLAEAGDLLRLFVTETLNGMLAPLIADPSHRLWSAGADQEAALYAQFDASCARLAERSLPELTLQDRAQVVTVEGYAAEGYGGERVIGQSGDTYLDEVRAAGIAGAALKSAAWKAVFLAGDWVTEEGGSGINPVRRTAGRASEDAIYPAHSTSAPTPEGGSGINPVRRSSGNAPEGGSGINPVRRSSGNAPEGGSGINPVRRVPGSGTGQEAGYPYSGIYPPPYPPTRRRRP